ncbi:hypothetical protein HID58_075642 [Brassica napus]|uniref:Uncharacterized protein n=1 Tax=Brassica napus TaxID=3708 RepID=A0ABQ7YNE8_BRANA|nr:hypothetical protein HID58_075642 [Brassica napus]
MQVFSFSGRVSSCFHLRSYHLHVLVGNNKPDHLLPPRLFATDRAPSGQPHLPVYPKISYLDILRVEAVENLAVTSLIPIQSQPQPGWGVWHDVVADKRLTYMENLIANHHPFKKHLWPGGDTSTPILIHKPPLEEPETRRQVSKNALRPRKPLNKPPPCRKQRRISNYFLRTGSTSNSNDQMMEMLSKVSSEVSKLRKEFRLMRQLNKRKKSRTHSKRSAFHSLIGSPHKPQLSHRGCQTDPTEHSTDDVPNETSPAPMEEDHPECTSPVVSQYAAQLYGQPSGESTPFLTTHLPTEPEQTTPVHTTTFYTLPEHTPIEPNHIIHNSPVHKSPVHNSPVHTSSVHTSPVHNSPVHTYPVHTSPVHTSPIHTSPIHTTPVHTTPVHNQAEHTTPIYDTSDHLTSPHYHQLRLQGFEIFEPISPDPPSLNNPRYDTSTHRATPKPPLNPITPDTSPTKSSGFAEHASSVNAFVATATSKRTSLPTLNVEKSQENLSDEEVVELSDSSPVKPTPRHQPSDEECKLAEELFKCPSIPALALIAPLPQQQWDLFHATLTANTQAFHITPSQFDFSNRFILEIAQPQKWVTTFHMEILMYMLAGRHRELLDREKLAFTTPYLASGIQETIVM